MNSRLEGCDMQHWRILPPWIRGWGNVTHNIEYCHCGLDWRIRCMLKQHRRELGWGCNACHNDTKADWVENAMQTTTALTQARLEGMMHSKDYRHKECDVQHLLIGYHCGFKAGGMWHMASKNATTMDSRREGCDVQYQTILPPWTRGWREVAWQHWRMLLP